MNITTLNMMGSRRGQGANSRHVSRTARRNLWRWLLGMLLLLPLAGYPQVPGNIDYRGYLTDETGVPLTGVVSVTFRIYDAAIEGSLLWEETQADITVSAGRFHALLGSVNSLQDDADIEGFNHTLFLSLAANGGAELTPRLPLPGGAFSFASAPTRGRTTVDCNAGQSIGQALARAPAGGRYVIEISGDCNESVTISRDRTTLRGIGGARLLGAYPSDETFGYAVAIAGARSVDFDALVIEPGPSTAEPGPSGIISYDNASFSLLNGSVVRDFAVTGVRLLENSSLLIRDATVTTNGGDGVAVLSGSFTEGVNATVTNNGDDGFVVHNNAAVVLRDSTVFGNGRFGVIVTLGSSLALDGSTTIESSIGRPSTGAAVGLFDRATLRVTGGGNRIANTVPALYVDDPLADGGGFALDAEHGSSVHIDRGNATIDGWVWVFNLSTIDIRDATINGHLGVSGSHANMRFRDQGGSVLNGNVHMRGGTFDAKRAPDPEAVLINGFVDCRGGSFGPTVDFANAADGYINCTGPSTDLALTLDASAGTVTVGTPVTYTATLDNLSSSPFVQGSNVTLNVDIDGLDYRIVAIDPSQGSCGDPPVDSLNGSIVLGCDLAAVGPGQVTVTVDVISDSPDTLTVNADISMSNPDANGANDTPPEITTTVTP